MTEVNTQKTHRNNIETRHPWHFKTSYNHSVYVYWILSLFTLSKICGCYHVGLHIIRLEIIMDAIDLRHLPGVVSKVIKCKSHYYQTTKNHCPSGKLYRYVIATMTIHRQNIAFVGNFPCLFISDSKFDRRPYVQTNHAK